MVDSPYHHLFLLSQALLLSNFITHRSYILPLLRSLLRLFVIMSIFCSSVGCVIVTFVGRTKQDRQRMYNIALRHVQITIVAMEKQYYIL
jgi:hypothetical protein